MTDIVKLARKTIKAMSLEQIREEFSYHGYDAVKMTDEGLLAARKELFDALDDYERFPDFLNRHDAK